MPVWLTLALKDLRLLSRDRVALFWVLGFPVLFAGFFGAILRAGLENDTAPMPVVVVGADDDARAGALASGLADAGLAVRRLPEAEAREAVRGGSAVAFVAPSPEPAGPVSIGIDPSRRSEISMLQGLVMRVLAPEFLPPGIQPPLIETRSVVRGERGPRSGYELVFPAMILWGLLGCAATFAVAMVTERTSGTLQRLFAAPISRATVLAGKGAACVLASLLSTVTLTGIGLWLLDVSIEAPLKYVSVLTAAAVCFAGLTMVLSVLGKTDQAVAGAGWSTLIVLAMLGGAMVPLSLMPEWLLGYSEWSPVKWGIRGLEGATWRRDTWPDLVRPLVSLCALGLTGFVAGATVLMAREG